MTPAGVLAMILVTVGLYGIIAYLAVSRRNEIGIRMSLGAAMRGLHTWLFGLSPIDLPTEAAGTCLLTAAAALAGCVPAVRAARFSPDIALRCD